LIFPHQIFAVITQFRVTAKKSPILIKVLARAVEFND
jgi:hypothetical protein